MSDTSTWFHGTFLHTPQFGTLEVLEGALIQVDAAGMIAAITLPNASSFRQELSVARESGQLIQLDNNQLFIPGFVDLHVHAPQWPQLGKALHLPLEDWLQEHTFPLESRYEDISYAQRVYPSLVRSLLREGTTTAMYFATLHEPATELLAQICLQLGQRAYVGRVAMDDPLQCPDYYRDASASKAVEASERSIRMIRQLAGNQRQLVQPVITPRFIPSCTDKLLAGLGELAKREDCHVQTHCSESDWEQQYVLDRLCRTDTQALSDFGLLTRHTVLAHSNFITDTDMDMIASNGAGIAHCPLSNAYFANSVFPLRKALDKSLRVGLGTDIAGGHSASMLVACQHSVSASRMLESGVNSGLDLATRAQPNSRINFMEAFYLATAGGADVLDCPTGLFSLGRQFDVLQLQLDHPANCLSEFIEADHWEDLLSKVVYNAQTCNISRVWVSGKQVDTC